MWNYIYLRVMIILVGRVVTSEPYLIDIRTQAILRHYIYRELYYNNY